MRGCGATLTSGGMSAVEIIELIEKLPPAEQAEVYALLEKKRIEKPEEAVRYLPQTEAEQIAERVFRDHRELFRKLAQ